MADLPNNSFVNVNDIETASDAPLTEALAQKYGTNENTNANEISLLDGRVTTLENVVPNVVPSAVLSGSTSSITFFTVASVAITPENPEVFVNLSGLVRLTVGVSNNVSFQITRNAATVKVFGPLPTSTSTFILPGGLLSFIDTGATPSVANTYTFDIAVGNGADVVTWTSLQLIAAELR